MVGTVRSAAWCYLNHRAYRHVSTHCHVVSLLFYHLVGVVVLVHHLLLPLASTGAKPKSSPSACKTTYRKIHCKLTLPPPRVVVFGPQNLFSRQISADYPLRARRSLSLVVSGLQLYVRPFPPPLPPVMQQNQIKCDPQYRTVTTASHVPRASPALPDVPHPLRASVQLPRPSSSPPPALPPFPLQSASCWPPRAV